MFQLNLKRIRENNNMSQYELAKKLGVSQSTVGMWESGKNKPEFANLQKIAFIYNVSTDYLLGDNNMVIAKKGIKIPVLGLVQAGLPVEAVENIIDYEEISEDMAETGDFFALAIKGNSMEPKFSENDVVIIKKQSYIDSGDIAIILINGDEATVKKVTKHSSGISLIPLNPDYDTLFFTNEEIESLPVTVLGKVVELRAKF